jgi:ferric-dicitrate binding protein FerR (iron transport regulator)
MNQQDQILQEYLKALENGQSLESLLQDIPDEAQELIPLLQLTAQIQQLPHPEQPPLQAASQQRRVLAAAQKDSARRQASGNQSWQKWLLAGGLVGVLGLIFALVLVTTAAAFAAVKIYHWTSVEVIEAAGVVQAASSDQPEGWRTIKPGERMREGERIRSLAGASATLRLSDGSLFSLDELTDVTLKQVEGGWNGKLSVVFIQKTGQTSHQVIPFTNDSSLYQVLTPSGTASVQGTNFGVTVDSATGNALFSVTEGRVWVASGGNDILLESGQAASTQSDLPPSTPAYGFQIKGTLQAWEEDSLVIGSILLNTSELLIVHGTPMLGEMARINGHIDETGEWVVDVLSSSGGKFQASFTGVLEASGETIWQISGTSVLVDENTKLSPDMALGEAVKVDFIVQSDGQWLATHIRPLDEEEEEVQPAEPPSEDTPPPVPVVTSEPAHRGTECTGADPQPTGMKLAERFGVPYEEIMGWFCQSFGFGEIDLAYSLSQATGIAPAEIFEMRNAGAGWGEIKKALSQDLPEDKIKDKKDKEDKEK